jgi:hypothetical protein
MLHHCRRLRRWPRCPYIWSDDGKLDNATDLACQEHSKIIACPYFHPQIGTLMQFARHSIQLTFYKKQVNEQINNSCAIKLIYVRSFILNCVKFVPGNMYSKKELFERKERPRFLAPPVTTVPFFLELASPSSC